jgi:hypothetical protein
VKDEDVDLNVIPRCDLQHRVIEVTQPIIKYLLIVAIQYNSIGLIKTQYRCNYTRAHAGHVML